MAVKILIDPCYLNTSPLHLLPRVLRSMGIPGIPGMNILPFRHRRKIGLFPGWALKDNDFDGLDLNFFYTSLLRPDLSLREDVLSLYQKARWPIFAFHATFAGGARFFEDTTMELSVDSERARRGLKSQIRAASAIGGPDTILVIHAGRIHDEKDKSLEAVARILSEAVPLAEDCRVILALENMPRSVKGKTPLGADYRDLKTLLEMFPSPCLKVCLDLGHAIDYSETFALKEGRDPLEGYLNSFGYCREIIQELGREIVYAHIHYNRSHVLRSAGERDNRDEHMPLSRIPRPYWEAYWEMLRFMMEKTSISETERVNLELIPRRFFRWFTIFPTGGTLSETLESARMLREVLNGSVQAGQGKGI